MEKIIKVATSHQNTLILLENGDVYAVGENSSGLLGFRHAEEVKEFTKVPGVQNIVDIAMGDDFSVLLREDGEVFTVGDNSKNQLMQFTNKKSQLLFKRADRLYDKSIVSIFAKHQTFVGIDVDGKLWLGGDNTENKTGVIGYQLYLFGPKNTIKGRVASVTIGETYIFAVLENGKILLSGKRNDQTYGEDTLEMQQNYSFESYQGFQFVNVKKIVAFDSEDGGNQIVVITKDGKAFVKAKNFPCELTTLQTSGDIFRSIPLPKIKDVQFTGESLIVFTEQGIHIAGDSKLTENRGVSTPVGYNLYKLHYDKLSHINIAGEGFLISKSDGSLWANGDCLSAGISKSLDHQIVFQTN